MKLNKITLLFALVIIFISCTNNNIDPIINPNEEVVFTRTLGGSKNEGARSIVKTNDGGYAILGFTHSVDGDITDKQNEQKDLWLITFDKNDQLQWKKTFGGSKDDHGEKIIQASDYHARVLQHEYDHLHQKLYIHRMNNINAFGFLKEMHQYHSAI